MTLDLQLRTGSSAESCIATGSATAPRRTTSCPDREGGIAGAVCAHPSALRVAQPPAASAASSKTAVRRAGANRRVREEHPAGIHGSGSRRASRRS